MTRVWIGMRTGGIIMNDRRGFFGIGKHGVLGGHIFFIGVRVSAEFAALSTYVCFAVYAICFAFTTSTLPSGLYDYHPRDGCLASGGGAGGWRPYHHRIRCE